MENNQDQKTTKESPKKKDPVSLWMVDLDHTLVKTDTGVERFIRWFLRSPFKAFLAALRGLSHRRQNRLGVFKKEVCDHAPIEIEHLPYRKELIEKIQTEKDNGTRVVLATASHLVTAEAVNDHLKLFDDVIGTEIENLKGEAKAKEVERRFSGEEYLYWGDSKADLKIWKRCQNVGVVNPSSRMLQKISKLVSSEQILIHRDPPVSFLRVLCNVLRPREWLTNLLLFFPVMGVYGFSSAFAWKQGLLAYLSFSGVQTSLSIFDDFFHLDRDRKKKETASRPLASGALSTNAGLFLFLVSLCTGMGVSLFLPPLFQAMLFVHVLLSILNSVCVFRIFLIEALLRGSLIFYRIVLGCVATWISPSPILILVAYSFFLSTSLAQSVGGLRKTGRGFFGKGDAEAQISLLKGLGIGIGFFCIFTFGAYLVSQWALGSEYLVSLEKVGLQSCRFCEVIKPYVFITQLLGLSFLLSRTWWLSLQGKLTNFRFEQFPKDPPLLAIASSFLLIWALWIQTFELLK